jgi:hypothetical protein
MLVLPVRVEHVLDVAVYRMDCDGDGLSLRGRIAAARPLTGTLDDFRRFYFREVSEGVMYPWPIGDFDNAMDVALDAAMNYLERTGQAQNFVEVQRVAAMAIVAAWKQGVRHRVKLTNIAIAAVERKMEQSPNQKRSQ